MHTAPRTTLTTTLKAALATAAVALSFGAAAAQADGRFAAASDIDQRQARQEQRIERAFARGEIDRRELRSLRQGQREIARTEAHALTDGRLSRQEWRQLTSLLDQAEMQLRQMRQRHQG